MVEPMMMAEFRAALERSSVTVFGEDGAEGDVWDAIGGIIRRLLAGERARCAAEIGKAAKACYDEATTLRGRNLPNLHLTDRGDTLELAEILIRNMGDPT